MPSLTVNGVTLNYVDTGAPRSQPRSLPIMLVHAFPFNSKMWDPQIEALSDRFRLIAPDLKGFGASDAPEDPTAYSMETYADELGGLLDALGLDRVVYVGLSMGGYIAFAFRARHPSRLHALVLADTRAEADTPEVIERRSGQQEQVRTQGTSRLIAALAGTLTSEATRARKPDVVARTKALMQNPVPGFIGALEAMKTRRDSSAELPKISVPTLIIVGEQDTLTPPATARRLHQHLQGSRLVVIPEAGHLSSLEAPDAFNGALAEFLSGL
jgi:3-oxoadipate enol-lactonase